MFQLVNKMVILLIVILSRDPGGMCGSLDSKIGGA
jgi:hypothetical protein